MKSQINTNSHLKTQPLFSANRFRFFSPQIIFLPYTIRQNKLPLRRGRAREPEPRPPPPVVRDEIRSTAIEGDDGDERERIHGDEVDKEMNETKEVERNEVNEEEDNGDVE